MLSGLHACLGYLIYGLMHCKCSKLGLIASLPCLHDSIIPRYVSNHLRMLKLYRCIYQDNSSDWAQEILSMGLIYTQAMCTISAASAEHSAGGLFFSRRPEEVQPIIVEFRDLLNPDIGNFPASGTYWCDLEDSWTCNVDNAPLLKRGWAHQERHLSPRIIHFTSNGPFWDCHELKATENYYDGFPAWHRRVAGSDGFSALKSIIHQLTLREEASSVLPAPTPITKSNIYAAWWTFLQLYTPSLVPTDSDKLVAIQGIAEQVGTFLDDQLVAGLWRNNMISDLCWRFVEPMPHFLYHRKKWRAPSWSWARIGGDMSVTNDINERHGDCPDRRECTEIVNISTGTSSTGILSFAHLQIKCKPILLVCKAREMSANGEFNGAFLVAKNQKEICCPLAEPWKLLIQVEIDPAELPRCVYLVLVQRCPHPGQQDFSFPGSTSTTIGLLLEPLFKHDSVYQRIGIISCSWDTEDAISILEAHDLADEAIITLI